MCPGPSNTAVTVCHPCTYVIMVQVIQWGTKSLPLVCFFCECDISITNA